MNFRKNADELVNQIQSYLHNEISIDLLNEFAWGIIDFFESSNSDDLPEEHEFEREFWYAVWQIQHLAGESEEALLRRELIETLKYLKGEVMMPLQYEGKRPVPVKRIWYKKRSGKK